MSASSGDSRDLESPGWREWIIQYLKPLPWKGIYLNFKDPAAPRIGHSDVVFDLSRETRFCI